MSEGQVDVRTCVNFTHKHTHTYILESADNIRNHVPTNTNVTDNGTSNHFLTSVNVLQIRTLYRN